jgi:type I restriction enzyme S subunit
MSRKMKDCGLQWIDKIPEDWSIKPLKTIFAFGKGLPITKADLKEFGLKVISYGQIHAKWNTGTYCDSRLYRYVDENYANTNPASSVPEYGFIFADTSEDLEGCGNCAYIDKEDVVFAGYHTIILKPYNLFDNKYLAYLFQTDAWRYQIRKELTEVKVYTISQKVLKKTSIILPQYEEQQVISAFLDLKCSAIDDSITKHKAIIDKLEEYRKALITQTVTKGFDSNAEMKDSGDNIIGAIPSSWECIRLKFLLSNEKNNLRVGPFGSSLPRKSYTDKGPWVYNQRCVLDNNFVTNDTHISENKFEELSGFQVYDGDILITTRGTIGRTAIVPYGSPKGILHPCLIRFRLDNNIISNKFIMFLFNYTDLPMGQIKRNSGSTTIEALYSGPLKDVFIPLPNKEEQELIIKTIETFNQKIDNALSQHNMLIAKLKEYKQSLIYNAVTGKIDCRKDV